MLQLILLAASRAPRILFLGAIALQFGISRDTDNFFLIYGVALFLVGTITYVGEVLAPNKRTLWVGVLASMMALLGITLIFHSLLALLFMPYVITASLASIWVGASTRDSRYSVLAYTSAPYLIGTGAVFFLSNLSQLIALITAIEATRASIGYLVTRRTPVVGISWTYASGMLVAVALGGSAMVVDRLFATLLGEGAVSHLAYAYGGILALANMASYSVSISRINNLMYHPPVMLGFAGSLGLVVLCGALSYFTGIYKTTFLIAALLAPIVFLSAMGGALTATFAISQSWRPVVFAAAAHMVTNILLDASFLRFGVHGIVWATLIAQLVFIGVLWQMIPRVQQVASNIPDASAGQKERG